MDGARNMTNPQIPVKVFVERDPINLNLSGCAEEPTTIHEITRSGTKGILTSSYFV
jgi:hypothetical protein